MMNRLFYGLIALVCAMVLTSSYYIELANIAQPCKLCVYERAPYIAAILVALLGYTSIRFRKVSSYMLIVIMIASIGLSFFHIGVEYKWFAFDSSCSTSDLASNSAEEFKHKLEQKDFVTCDQANFKIFNLSLTTWNFIISLVLFLLILTSLLTSIKPKKYRRGKWY